MSESLFQIDVITVIFFAKWKKVTLYHYSKKKKKQNGGSDERWNKCAQRKFEIGTFIIKTSCHKLCRLVGHYLIHLCTVNHDWLQKCEQKKLTNPISRPAAGQGRECTVGFETLCTNVGDLCSNLDDNGDDIILRIQEMLLEIADQPELYQNAATAVAVTQLLLPVMGLSNRNFDERLTTQETAINKPRASVRLNT